MTDPFASALTALFESVVAEAATYYAGGAGPGLPISVVHGQPDQEIRFGARGLIAASNLIEIQRSDVALPASGDVLELASGRFMLAGEPRLDVEGLTWTCGAEPEA